MISPGFEIKIKTAGRLRLFLDGNGNEMHYNSTFGDRQKLVDNSLTINQ